MKQLDLYDALGPAVAVPRARRSDPWTSHAAARSINGLTARQNAVWNFLYQHGPLTDEELVNDYTRTGRDAWPAQSPSGLRTRRKELADRSLVEEAGDTIVQSGRRAIIWRARSVPTNTVES